MPEAAPGHPPRGRPRGWRFRGLAAAGWPPRRHREIEVDARSHLQMTGDMTNRFPKTRMRRMRRHEFSRRLMRETQLPVDSLIYPMFVVEGRKQRQTIAAMPSIERVSVDELLRECESLVKLKVPAIALF